MCTGCGVMGGVHTAPVGMDLGLHLRFVILNWGKHKAYHGAGI